MCAKLVHLVIPLLYTREVCVPNWFILLALYSIQGRYVCQIGSSCHPFTLYKGGMCAKLVHPVSPLLYTREVCVPNWFILLALYSIQGRYVCQTVVLPTTLFTREFSITNRFVGSVFHYIYQYHWQSYSAPYFVKCSCSCFVADDCINEMSTDASLLILKTDHLKCHIFAV